MANQVHGPEGMIFANKYRIVKLIGSGGMANVYLGIDMNTGYFDISVPDNLFNAYIFD